MCIINWFSFNIFKSSKILKSIECVYCDFLKAVESLKKYDSDFDSDFEDSDYGND